MEGDGAKTARKIVLQRLRIERQQADRRSALVLPGEIHLAVEPLDDLAIIQLCLLAEQITKERGLRLIKIDLEPLFRVCQRIDA